MTESLEAKKLHKHCRKNLAPFCSYQQPSDIREKATYIDRSMPSCCSGIERHPVGTTNNTLRIVVQCVMYPQHKSMRPRNDNYKLSRATSPRCNRAQDLRSSVYRKNDHCCACGRLCVCFGDKGNTITDNVSPRKHVCASAEGKGRL